MFREDKIIKSAYHLPEVDHSGIRHWRSILWGEIKRLQRTQWSVQFSGAFKAVLSIFL
jgi:hypothetical protein